MNKQNELIKRIDELYPKFSKGQKKLANYIIEHYEKAVFLTAAKLGSIVGLSESTVVRFATELGYDGYPQFQRALGELVKNRLTSMQRVEVTADRIENQSVLKYVLHSDEDKIKQTLEEIDEETFQKAVDMMLGAKTIYIIGVRSSSALANFMGFYLNLILDNIKHIHTNSFSEMFEQIYRVDKDDVVIGISYPRYSKKTLKAMEFAKSREAKVLTITDSIRSPLNEYSDCSLIARSDMASFVGSLVAPLSVINALIVAISMNKKETLISALGTLEEIWDEYEVYEQDDELGYSRSNR